jgi:dipeptidyl aminopeptidase/acylaminoacyl peptidase
VTPIKTTGLLVLAVALLVPAALARADGRRITLDDLARIARVTDPQISPDGRSVAVVVARPDYDEDRWQPELVLVLVDVPSGAQRALTHERRGVDHPRWSSSGDRLAFLATTGAGKEEQAQIFVMPMNGGDTQRITSAPRGVQQFTWSPDGGQIAYVTADEPRKAGKYDDAFEVGDHEMLLTAAQAPSHVWLVSADGTGALRLTSGTWGLPTRRPPGPPAHPLSWSPDGKTIVVTRRETPYGGDMDASAIQLVDVASGSVRPLTAGKLFEGFAAFSPDSARIAYAFPGDGDRRNGTEVYVAPHRRQWREREPRAGPQRRARYLDARRQVAARRRPRRHRRVALGAAAGRPRAEARPRPGGAVVVVLDRCQRVPRRRDRLRRRRAAPPSRTLRDGLDQRPPPPADGHQRRGGGPRPRQG